MLPKLNFPIYNFRLRKDEKGFFVFDPCRQKYVRMTSEEWVRQHCLKFLTQEKNYPLSIINTEKNILVNGLKKRYDLVVYYPNGLIKIAVECKAPTVPINQAVFEQMAVYNLTLRPDYFWLTNGLTHVFAVPDTKQKTFVFIKDLPVYTNG